MSWLKRHFFQIWSSLALAAVLAGMVWVCCLIAQQAERYEHRYQFCTYACDYPLECPQTEHCERGLTVEQVLERRMELTHTQLGVLSEKIKKASENLREADRKLREAIDAGLLPANNQPEDGE